MVNNIEKANKKFISSMENSLFLGSVEKQTHTTEIVATKQEVEEFSSKHCLKKFFIKEIPFVIQRVKYNGKKLSIEYWLWNKDR